MWFESIIHVVLSVVTVAALLCGIAVVFGFVTRRRYPALEHACWVVVLLRLAIPPFVPIATPGFPAWPAGETTVTSPDLPQALELTRPIALRDAVSPKIDAGPLEETQRFPNASEVTQPAQDGDPAWTENPAVSSDPKIIRAQAATTERVIGAAAPAIAPIDYQTPITPSPAISNQSARSADAGFDATAVPVVAQTTVSLRQAVTGLLLAIWVAGSLVVLLKAVRSTMSFARLLKFSEPASDDVQSAANDVAGRVGLSKVPTVRTLAARIPPLVWSGLGRVLVVLPRDFAALSEPTKRDVLLAHEFAHIQRRDYLVRWLELIVAIVWWWCPLLWIARSRLRSAEEAACDARVLRLWPEQAEEYAHAIVDTVSFVADAMFQPQLATGGLGSLRELKSRLRSIRTNRPAARTGVAGVGLVVLLAAISCPLMLVGEPADNNPAPGESSDAPAESTETATEGEAREADNTAQAQTNDSSDQAQDATIELPPNRQQRRETARATLPIDCDPLYAVVSPDQSKTAFVGSRTGDDGAKQHGLFCYDATNRTTTCLIEKALKTAPAWSPDSRKLAIGNSPGYGNVYPLVIVDVTSGELDETGVQGVGAAWSPNGRDVAVSTKLGLGGSWSAGVPSDGRIGIWNTKSRQLTYVSPVGVNRRDRAGNFAFMTGGIFPVWSPNGQWLAWQQRVYQWLGGKEKDSRSEIWVAKPDGTSLQRVFKESHEVRWSDDSLSLAEVQSGAVAAVKNEATADDWPAMPAELQEMLALEQTATKRAAEFQADDVLQANQLWQNPSLDGIDSIEFTHRMSPQRLDELFQWQKDGTLRVEVTHREDDPSQYGVGWSVLRTPDGASFTFASTDSYPRHRTPEDIVREDESSRSHPLTAAQLLRRTTLRHLSGTRLNFAAIDWGRRPHDFVVTDYTRTNDTRKIELRARRSGSRRMVLNGGAMFETTSWAYVHDLRYDRSLLTIDADDRIIREVAYSGDTVLAEIDLLDWTTKGGQQAPLRIVMEFPTQKLVVDQKFQVTAEGLWVLSQGTSRFGDRAGQTEEIVGLKVNGSSDALTKRVAAAKRLAKELSAPVEAPRKVALQGLTPLEFGATQVFDPNAASKAEFRPTSLRWMPIDLSSQDQSTWPTPVPCVELRFPSLPQRSPDRDVNLMVVMYDEHRLPLFASTIPESAIAASTRPADEVLEPLLQKHQLWLRPKDAPLPTASYTFRLQDNESVNELPSKDLKTTRGITLAMALDSYRWAPQAWKMPIAFTADWNGRAVRVFGLTAPSFHQEFGSGLPGQQGRGATYIGGYSSTRQSDLFLVVDAKTGFPLVERSESMEFQFLDYVEATPGQFAPLRVICRTETMGMDLRFQVLDGRLWLFDRKAQPDKGAAASTSQITIESKAPTKVVKSPSPDATGSLPWFPWQELASRAPERKLDQLSASFAAFTQPWTHPSFSTLGALSVETEADGVQVVRCRQRSYPSLGIARYWTLTRISGETAEPLTCADTLVDDALREVAVVPFELDQKQLVPLQPAQKPEAADERQVGGSASPKTRVREISISRDEQHRAVISAEVLSMSYYTDQTVRVTGVLIRDGVVVAAGSGSDSFRTHAAPVVSKDARIHLLNSEHQTGTSVLLGHRSVVTGAPMGSTWGRFMNGFETFRPEDLLASRFAPARHVGLQQLYIQQRRDIQRQYERRARGRDDRRVAEALIRYRSLLWPIVSDRSVDSPEAVAIACRLAGFSENPDFVKPLYAMLNHESPAVQESAAIGLGLLRQQDVLERLREIAAQPSPSDDTVTDPLQRYTKQDATRALTRTGA